MLEIFEKVVNCIRKSLLQPIKTAVEALCRKDIDILYVADVTFEFMLDEISSQNTTLSVELKEALIDRISMVAHFSTEL